jgi:hypothetical protein
VFKCQKEIENSLNISIYGVKGRVTVIKKNIIEKYLKTMGKKLPK